MRKSGVLYVSCGILYFLFFFCAYVLIKNHFEYYDFELEEYVGNGLGSHIAGGILFLFWVISSKYLSSIVYMKSNKEKRMRAKILKEQYRNIRNETIEEELYSIMRSSSIFSYNNVDAAKERKRKDHSDILFIREQNEKIKYLKDNVPIWVVISIIFFVYGYIW